MNNQFSNLPLTTEFLENLSSLGYTEMTPIQVESLPLILQGRDVIAQAKTGSGKTAAFGIGLLQQLNSKQYHTQVLVICPTRELADQVSKELRRLARPIANTKISTLCGGMPIGPQIASLQHQPHIVVGTPGRLLKLLKQRSLKLEQCTGLVLDEADRMLDMGFHDDIMAIIEDIPKKRQTLLFSATYPTEIKRISKKVQQDPKDIQVEALHAENKIEQIFYQVENHQRSETTVALLRHFEPQSTLIFCNRKQQCREVCNDLRQAGFQALALHGDLEQKERDQVLVQFANKSSNVLVATDVAARGLDIKDLSAVINYELSPDPEVHIHRIGRTGRADQTGLALSLFKQSEAPKLVAIEKLQQQPVAQKEIADLAPKSLYAPKPVMVTLCIQGGRKNKIRPGDILGALTAGKEIEGKQIGKIDLFDIIAYVAVDRSVAAKALDILNSGKIKGRKYKVRKIR